MDNKFIVVMPFYNAEKWITKSIKSLMLQDYTNYECIIMDDNSTDNSSQIVKKQIASDSRFHLHKNPINIGPLGNAYTAVFNDITHINNEDIIVILDGDDFLAGGKCLSTLNEFYNENECWMTYGSYINLSTKQRGKFSRPPPEHVITNNLYREYEWCTSHLRTYKRFLLDHIDVKDLLDENEDFLKAAGDLALMFPLLELCGHKAKYVKNIMYIWNDLNELNEHKDKRELQLKCEQHIRSLKKYDCLKGL
jgi:glycosyltransferase involved in cell wall biosynthesis